MSFQFSLIRFVPDVARGEFVNIGAIAGSEAAGEWELRLIGNLTRAKALDDRGVLAKAFEWAAGLEDHLIAVDQLPGADQAEPMTFALLQRQSVDMQNIVQVSTPAPIAAESAEEALDLIFEHQVLDVARRSFPFAKKNRAQGAARRAYADNDVPAAAIRERARVRSGVYDGGFDFAIHNGRTVQLAQCWSFQLPNQTDLAEQVKAWSWLVHELRNDGGELVIGDASVEVPAELEIFAVAIPPLEGRTSPAYVEAQEAFRENNVVEVGTDDADLLGQQARQALATAV